MRYVVAFSLSVSLGYSAAAQQIYDIYSTTWDRSSLFTYTNLGSKPINFGSPGAAASADIVINDGQQFQPVYGFGGSLTDSSAQLLNNLKNANSGQYNALLQKLFSPTDGQPNAGLSYLRVPLGASDFSASTYSFDDQNGDTSLSTFNINRAPSYLFNVINDIRGINPYLKIHVLPWSPPGWMKDSGTMLGGNFLSQYTNQFAQYLLKSLQGFQSHGIPVYAVSIQNEPQNSNPTYPTCKISASQEAQIGLALRPLLNNNGFSSTKIIGFDHNWDGAGTYAVQLMQQASSAFAGVAFHCYGGNKNNQDTFHNAYPDKEIYFTECTGTMGSDWWGDIKWNMDNLYIGAIEHNSRTALEWNVALDGNGQPVLPGSNSCKNPPCRGIVTISGTSYTLNQEFYAMAQASKAILPRDTNGPFGIRIGVSVGGSQNGQLRVNAFVTGRANPSDWSRYSIVVLNWNDNVAVSWNPQPVTSTIEFRGQQAEYTFPVGVTTLWWYAPASGSSAAVKTAGAEHASKHEDGIPVHGSTQIPLSSTASVKYGNATASAHHAQATEEKREPLFRFRRSY
ncbi:glycoside hydrolase [Cristinia sonorae]|uniref:Glycoside hydrolase n=1 Tax=Cristinia sonorae TaxID=1940300 RepID=A0A8K0UVQ1_9AGAR|nr:glycoside hydrolase [Cristinia sonorae]